MYKEALIAQYSSKLFSTLAFLTSSLPGAAVRRCTLPARLGGHKMCVTLPSMSARGTCRT